MQLAMMQEKLDEVHQDKIQVAMIHNTVCETNFFYQMTYKFIPM